MPLTRDEVEQRIEAGSDCRNISLEGECRGLYAPYRNLTGLMAQWCDLRDGDFTASCLRHAQLRGANLRGVYFREGDLSHANLRGADLRGASLADCNMFRASLAGADLRGAFLPAPAVLLLAAWPSCSPELTTELMRYDAANHLDPASFSDWAAGGPCPYSGARFARAANFPEHRHQWSPGPAKSALELAKMLLDEHCIWRGEAEAADSETSEPPTETLDNAALPAALEALRERVAALESLRGRVAALESHLRT